MKAATLFLWAFWIALVFPAELAAQARAERGFQEVTVRPGDTLWAIANRYLKDPTRWNEILKHNTLPSSDPTVALPGLVLRVPVSLIKENMLAASLVYTINEVLARKRQTPEWKAAVLKMQLFRDDGLRTLKASRARVRFVNGELLNLDENSMAILKPKNSNADLELRRGEIHAGASRVITPAARITPKLKGTRYSAKVREDLSTSVQVYTGAADVEGQGKVVEVRAGHGTEISLNRPPIEPVALPRTAEFMERMSGGDVFAAKVLPPVKATLAEAERERVLAGAVPNWSTLLSADDPRDIEQIRFDLKALQVGIPVAAYHVQVAKTPDFTSLVVQKTFEADERVELGLPAGRYWVRVAIVDLLGAKGGFSEPRQYLVGAQGASIERDPFAGRFEVIRPPEEGETAHLPQYRIVGKTHSEFTVLMNNIPINPDEEGNFSFDVSLQKGENRYRFVISDGRGREKEVVRVVTYEP